MDTQTFKPFINDDFDFSNHEQLRMALQALEAKFAMRGYPNLSHQEVMTFLSGYATKWHEDFLGPEFQPEMLLPVEDASQESHAEYLQ